MYAVMLKYDEGEAFLIGNVYDDLDAAKDVAKDAVANDPSLDHVKVYKITAQCTELSFIAEQAC